MHFLEVNILGNAVRDYLISLAIFICAIVLAAITNHFLKKYIISWAQKTQTELDEGERP